MNTIEIMAIIVVLLAIVKLVFVLTKPKAWIKAINFVYAKPNVTGVVSALLALIVLYFLIQEITIVQIFAVLLFMMLLLLSQFSAYAKDIKALGEKVLKDKNAIKRAWLVIVIWLALMIWVVYEVVI